jgi:hypothetical protein
MTHAKWSNGTKNLVDQLSVRYNILSASRLAVEFFEP